MYRNFYAHFWNDPKVRKLPPGAKLLFSYLFTNSHSHIAGIYYLPIMYIAKETGLKEKDITEWLNLFSRDKLAFYDFDREVILVLNMFKHQARGAKNIQSAANHLSTLHETPLIVLFLEHYKRFSIPYRYPIDTLSDVENNTNPLSVTVSVSDTVSDSNRGIVKGDSIDFDEFWKSYPKHIAKLAAQKAWKKLKPEEKISAIDALKKYPFGTDLKFVPNPATWLNGGRWNDENVQEALHGKPKIGVNHVSDFSNFKDDEIPY